MYNQNMFQGCINLKSTVIFLVTFLTKLLYFKKKNAHILCAVFLKCW